MGDCSSTPGMEGHAPRPGDNYKGRGPQTGPQNTVRFRTENKDNKDAAGNITRWGVRRARYGDASALLACKLLG